jgi:predicted metal-binding membrane protein
MVLLIAFGVLNVTAMVILASIVLVAKRFTRE